MPITKDGSGTIVETPVKDKDQYERTGVIRDDSFAIADDIDKTKQIRFEASSQSPNKSVTIAAGGNTTDVVITLPATSGTLAVGGATNAFSTVQAPAGTSPVASGASTLTVTNDDGNVVTTGDSADDSLDFSLNPNLKLVSISDTAPNESLLIKTLNNGAGASGDINFTTGTASTVRGGIYFNGDVVSFTAPGGVALFAPTVYLDQITASRALTTNAFNQMAASATTATELGYLSGVTSAVQTQLDAKGDAYGPASSTDTALVRFSGTGGKTLQNSVVTLSATQMAFPTTATLTIPHGTRSERIGSGSLAPADDGIAIGNGANVNSASFHKAVAIGSTARADGDSGTAIGYAAYANQNSTAIGRAATAGSVSNTLCTAIGYGASATFVRGMCVGGSSVSGADSAHAFGNQANASHQASICIGYSATSTAANQLVIGGTETRAISTAHIGSGVTSTAPLSTLTISSTGGSGSNVAGTSIIIQSGKGTGTATPAYVAINATTTAASGATVQSTVERFRANGTGIGFFAVTPVAQQTGGAATAGGTYGATEQTMLNAVYTALRNYGLLT